MPSVAHLHVRQHDRRERPGPVPLRGHPASLGPRHRRRLPLLRVLLRRSQHAAQRRRQPRRRPPGPGRVHAAAAAVVAVVSVRPTSPLVALAHGPHRKREQSEHQDGENGGHGNGCGELSARQVAVCVAGRWLLSILWVSSRRAMHSRGGICVLSGISLGGRFMRGDLGVHGAGTAWMSGGCARRRLVQYSAKWHQMRMVVSKVASHASIITYE